LSRVALVTGGAGGIGGSIADELVNDGWVVAVADLAAPTRAEGYSVTLDVTDATAVTAAVAEVSKALGAIDLLVCAAGIQRQSSIVDFDLSDWRAVFDVNFHGAFHCMRAVAPAMRANQNGVIVNISSVAAVRGVPMRAAYAASKAALESLTRSAAVEWAPFGVRVNAVAPAYVETDLVRKAQAAGKLDVAAALARTPLRRMAQAIEIARLVRFLASDDASYITGEVVAVDGGFLAAYGVEALPE
jgi:NAD(P)-dependent dehydrogenase (short-subunit alcohol dehydrogenase family)